MQNIAAPGHLFVIRGDIFKLHCSARVVSGDGRVIPRPGKSWKKPLEGVPSVENVGIEEHQFRLWCRGRVGAAQAEPDTWVINVTDIKAQGGVVIVERIKRLIEFIVQDAKERASLEIALPFLGTGGAGGQPLSAGLLQIFLHELQQVAIQLRVAIILVFFHNEEGFKAYAMAQAIRQKEADWFWSQQRWDAVFPKVQASALAGRLAVFVGAGVSRAAGLPNWSDLLQKLHQQLVEILPAPSGLPGWESLSKLDTLLCGQVIQEWWPGSTYAEKRAGLQAAIVRLVEGERYGLQHALLAALPVQDFITTNYDTLLEKAAEDSGRAIYVISNGNLQSWTESRSRRVLKLHGTLPVGEKKAGRLVLTTQDYLRFNEKSAALGGAVQGLMLSHHLLFIGFGMTDPNFLRLHDSVARLLPWDRSEGTIGTAVLVESEPWKIEFANRLLSGIVCVRPVPDGLGAEMRISREARWLEIFLDRLVCACAIPVAHIADDKYSELLDREDAELLKHLKALPVAETQTPLHEKVRALLVEIGAAKTQKTQRE